MRARRGRRVPPVRRLRLASCTATRCRTSSTATSTRRSTCSRRTSPGWSRVGGFRRLAPKVRQYLRDPRTQRVFSFQSMYAGLSPYDALALYAVIAYMDSVAGVYFPAGGMHAVPRALAAAAEKHGVDIRYGITVTSVERARPRASAVHDVDRRADCRGRRRAEPGPAGRPARPASASSRAGDAHTRPSCFLLLAGSIARYRQIAHHNIHFGRAGAARSRTHPTSSG